MNFLNPVFLWALPLVSIPVFLHLIERRPPTKQLFAHIDWIRRAHESLMPKKKLKDLLLLMARTLLLLFLVMFFARPVVQKTPFVASAGVKNEMVVLLDMSGSMNAVVGGNSALDLSKAVIQGLGRKMAPGDRWALVAFSDRIEKEVALSDDRPALVNAVNSLKPTYRGSDISPAVEQAYKMLETSKGTKRSIVIVSDQAEHVWKKVEARGNAWEGFDPDIRVVLYEALPYVDNSGFHDALLATSEEGVLKGQAYFHNFGGTADARWTLEINKKIVDQGPSNSLALRAQFPSGGFYSGVLSKSADGAPFDDSFYLAGRVPAGYRLLIVDGEGGLAPSDSEAYYLKSALESPRDPRLETLRVIRPESLPQEDFSLSDVIVLANVLDFGGRESDLRSWVEKGGGLFLSAGTHWPRASSDPLGFLRPQTIVRTKSTLMTPDRETPFVSHLAEGDLFQWGQVSASTYVRFELDAASEALLKFSDGDPFLIRKQMGGGTVLCLASSLDRAWTNFPTKPLFAPLLRELVSTLADPLREQDSLNGVVGQPFRARVPPSIKSLTVIAPDGTSAGAAIPSAGVMEWANPSLPGLYQVKTEKRDADFVFAINAANLKEEGDLTRVSLDEIQDAFPKASVVWVGTSSDGAQAVFSTLQGRDATGFFLIAIFVLLILEMLIAWPKTSVSWFRWALPVLLLTLPLSTFAAGGNNFIFAQLEHDGAWDPYPSVDQRILQSVKQMTNIPFSSARKKVSLDNDEIFEQPFLLVKGNTALTFNEREKRRLKQFVDRGGFVFFDDTLAESRGLFSQSVRSLMSDLYPDRSMKKLPIDHALFRSFFLLRNVSGRRISEKALEGLDVGGNGGGEGRTAVVLCTNDLLGAWVRDNLGQYLYSCEPGGETQRWEAMKLTLNIIYFSLTGTYKKDAVHQPFIEQKLGS